jgi:hypothetical protein
MSRRERERYLSAAAIIVAPLNLSTDNAVREVVSTAVKLHDSMQALNAAENKATSLSQQSSQSHE